MAHDPTDGSTKQWDKLQKMRRASGTALTNADGTPNPDSANTPGNEQRATPEEIAEEQRRLQSGEPLGGDESTDDDGDDDDTDGDDAPPDETVPVQAHERAKPKPKPADDPAPAGTEWVEIDGNRVAVDASLAAAFRDAETAHAADTQHADRQQLVDDIVTRVTEKLPKAPTPAETAAAQALPAAPEEPLKYPMPDGNLSVTDPDAFAKQLQAHIDEKAARAAQKAVADKEARDNQARQTNQQEEARRQEVWAREQLGIQFYRQFKVLDDPDVKTVVDVLLNKKFDEVIASGILAKPLPPKEAEAMKLKAFNDVAAAATRQIVKLRGKANVQPSTAPEPPKVLTGQSSRGPKAKSTPPPAKPKEKYPTGSVSAMLAEHKAKKEAAPPRP